jgi:hypothetical protein
LKNLIKQTMSDTSNEQIIFINAWNEWAEGMYLEPDRTYGRRRLKMIIDSLTEAQAESS